MTRLAYLMPAVSGPTTNRQTVRRTRAGVVDAPTEAVSRRRLAGFRGMAGRISRERFEQLQSELGDVPEVSGSIAAVKERD